MKLGLLGLCAMLFGLMAFSTSAQATVGAKWLVLNAAGTVTTTVGTGTLAAVPLGLEAETVLVLHSEILKIKTLFECSSLATENAKLLANGSIGEAAGAVKGSRIVFSKCITKLNGATATECEPKDPVTGAGTIRTNPGHALIVLHELAGGEKDDLVLVLPDEGKTFATIILPAACPIGTKVPVIGHVTLKDCLGNEGFLKHEIKHLTEIFTPLTTLWTISETAEHVATLLGSSWAFLTGAEHVGLKWAGDPI